MKLRMAERFGYTVEEVDVIEATKPGLFATLLAFENVRGREERK